MSDAYKLIDTRVKWCFAHKILQTWKEFQKKVPIISERIGRMLLEDCLARRIKKNRNKRIWFYQQKKGLVYCQNTTAWPDKMVYVTPSTHRVLSKTSVHIDLEEERSQCFLKSEETCFPFTRPRAYAQSNATPCRTSNVLVYAEQVLWQCLVITWERVTPI